MIHFTTCLLPGVGIYSQVGKIGVAMLNFDPIFADIALHLLSSS